MKHTLNEGDLEEEIVDKSSLPDSDEMDEIRIFIRKKQLENEVLKKLADGLQNENSTGPVLKKPRSAFRLFPK